MSSLLNRAEIKRLQKAASSKDLLDLARWAEAYDKAVERKLQWEYNEGYERYLCNALDTLIIAMLYTAQTDPNITIKRGKSEQYFDNFIKSIDNFRTGKYKEKDYKEALTKAGRNPEAYNYSHRITPIIAIVVSEECLDQIELARKYFKDRNLILIEMDNFRGNEEQIKKNVNILNMCDILYCIGDNECITAYKQYCDMHRKTYFDGDFINYDPEEYKEDT